VAGRRQGAGGWESEGGHAGKVPQLHHRRRRFWRPPRSPRLPPQLRWCCRTLTSLLAPAVALAWHRRLRVARWPCAPVASSPLESIVSAHHAIICRHLRGLVLQRNDHIVMTQRTWGWDGVTDDERDCAPSRCHGKRAHFARCGLGGGYTLVPVSMRPSGGWIRRRSSSSATSRMSSAGGGVSKEAFISFFFGQEVSVTLRAKARLLRGPPSFGTLARETART
jgi:hypothetical protein